MKKQMRYIVLLLLVLPLPGLYAQKKIDLSRAVHMAVTRHPLVKAQESKIRQARAKNRQVRSAFLPQFNVLTKYFYTNNTPNFYPLLGKDLPITDANGPTGETVTLHPMAPYADLDRDILMMDMNLVYPIYTGHKRQSALALTRKLADAYRQNETETEAQIAYRVKQLFYNYLMLGAVIDVYHDVLDQLNAHLALAREAYRQGMRSEFDVINFESKIEEFKTKIIDMEGKRQTVKTALERLIGIPDGQEVEFVGDLNGFYAATNGRPLDPLDSLLNNNAKIHFLDRMTDVLDEKAKMTRAAKLPVVFAFGNYHIYHGRDFPPFDKTWHNGYAVGVGLKMNLFDGNKTLYQIDEIRAKQEELAQYKEGMQLKLHIEYQKTLEEIHSLEAQKQARETHLQVAHKAYQIAQTAYKNGVITNIQLNDAQLNLMKIRTGILKVEKDILIKRAYLDFLEGKIK